MARIPKRIKLWFGYGYVSIKQISQKEMADRLGEEIDQASFGYWEAESKTIFIRKNLPHPFKCYIIGHEIDHVINDWRHWCAGKGVMKG